MVDAVSVAAGAAALCAIRDKTNAVTSVVAVCIARILDKNLLCGRCDDASRVALAHAANPVPACRTGGRKGVARENLSRCAGRDAYRGEKDPRCGLPQYI